MKIPRFSDLIGETLLVKIPALNSEKMEEVKILAVEVGGLWFESQTMNNSLLSEMKLSAAEVTPIFFVPYSQISFIVNMIDQPSLSEDALLK